MARLPVPAAGSDGGSVSDVTREGVGTAVNALNPGFYHVLAVCLGRVGCAEKSSCCLKKSGVKSVALCIERLHVMLYHS